MLPPDPSLSSTPYPRAVPNKVPAFPTRHYPYRRPAVAGGSAAEVPEHFQPEPGRVYRFFLGRDTAPVVLSTAQVLAQVQDPFAKTFLHRERGPQTLRELLAVLDAESAQPGGLPRQQVFLVGDGGQIPWTSETAGLERNLRFAIVRHRGGDAELMVSTAAPFDSPEVFLQVLAWDEVNAAFQFYERRRGAWFWAGSSWEALAEDTRGHGPFDSHVNGGVVMKELKLPWLHWNSISAGIQPSVLAPKDPLRDEPLFAAIESADQLELLVRGALFRWTEARFARRIVGGRLTRAREFFRQVLETTSVNLTTAREVSRTLSPGDVLNVPRTFFLHTDALLSELRLRPKFPSPQASAQSYLDCIARYAVALRAGEFSLPGDTHFAFPVPEPALEDLVVLRGLLARNFLSPKLAAALLMVDFPNPIFSPRRAHLTAHLPDEVEPGDGPGSFAAQFLAAIEAAAVGLPGDAPENEFLALWRVPDASWEADYTSRIEHYLSAIATRIADATGFDDYFRLGESRRREFRKRPLAEFSLTTPSTNIPENELLLEMQADGRVRAKAS